MIFGYYIFTLMVCILLWKYDGILFEKNKDLLNCVISMDTYG
jgi:hypothetical protein